MKQRYTWIVAIGFFLCLISFVVLFQNKTADFNQSQTATILRVAIAADLSTKYDQMLFDAFMEENPDVKIETISFLPSAYSSNLQALMSGQQPVDVIFIKEISQLGNLVSNGTLKPLDFSLSQSEISPEMLIGYEELKSHVDDAHYALPYRVEKYFLYYNKDLFDAANVAYPSPEITWYEFQKIGEIMNERLEELGMEGKKAVLFLPDGNDLMRMTIPDFSSLMSGNLEQLSRSLEMMEQMMQEGTLVPFSQSYEQNFQQKIFETGNYGMFITSSAYIPSLLQEQAEGKLNFEWGLVSQPFWPEEKSGDSLRLIMPVCIYRYTEQPEIAWKFISFLCGERGASLTAQNLLFPAYRSETAQETLITSARERHIETTLLSDMLQTSLPTCLTTDEIDLLSFINNEYMNVLVGLTTREQCIDHILSVF